MQVKSCGVLSFLVRICYFSDFRLVRVKNKERTNKLSFFIACSSSEYWGGSACNWSFDVHMLSGVKTREACCFEVMLQNCQSVSCDMIN